jgi:hypothetical protein
MVPVVDMHISRSHWSQIIKRARLAKFEFDAGWKCLICGTHFQRCYDHTVEQNQAVLAEAKVRAGLQTA